VQETPLRHPKIVFGAGAYAATDPPYLRPATCYKWPWCTCQSLFRELGSLQLLATLVHTLWLASWCRSPHCAILNQVLELKMVLLLALLTFTPEICYNWPWCTCQSLFRELGSLQLLALLYNPLAGVLVQETPLGHPKIVAGAGADASTGPPHLCPRNLLQVALVHLPKLVPRAGIIAAACPPCAYPLAGVLVQEAPLCHPQ